MNERLQHGTKGIKYFFLNSTSDIVIYTAHAMLPLESIQAAFPKLQERMSLIVELL